MTLDDDGMLIGEVESASLMGAINKFDKILNPFMMIPGKENGIDIEGIAAQGDNLFIGFRGPVLRENWVPVIVTKFENIIEHAELRFVNLGGLGIRDMVAVNNELFFIIAGPVGDGSGGFHLYSWNGLDSIPGKNGAKGHVKHLGRIPTESGSKAEGITILASDRDDLHRVLIVFDGPKRGNPISFTLPK